MNLSELHDVQGEFTCSASHGFVVQGLSAVSARPAAPATSPSEPRGYDEGFAAGRAAALAEAIENNAARERLAGALAMLAEQPDERLAELLFRKLRELLVEMLGAAHADAALIKARCHEVAAGISAQYGDHHLEVSAADYPLLAEAAVALPLVIDEALLPGSVRLRHARGEILGGSAALLARLDLHIEEIAA